MSNKKIIGIIIAGFGLGILFSIVSFFTYQKIKPLSKKILQRIEEKRIANMPKATAPLMICDFENQKEIEKWEFKNAEGQLLNENATSGKNALKVKFKPSNGASFGKIENYFEKNRQLTDWSTYEAISFDIFNPYKTKEGLTLQIKDSKGKRYKQKLMLSPLVNNHIEVALIELQSQLNTGRIEQFELFLWKSKNDKIFFVDNITLLPSARIEKRAASITSMQFIPKGRDEIYKTGYYFDFTKNKQKWLKQDSLTGQTYIELPLYVKADKQVYLDGFPVSGGVPFPYGELKSDDKLIVVDSQNDEIPIQTKVLCRWPDKSIKWLLLDMDAVLSAEEKEYLLRYSPDIKRKNIDTPLNITEDKTALSVVTGPMKFTLNKNGLQLFDNLWLDVNNDGIFSDSETILKGGDFILMHDGKEYRSSLDKNYKLEIEENGPLTVGLKASGWFTSIRGERFCQFIIRLKAFKDKSFLKINHTFVYTGYPENKHHYLYQGKRLPENEPIEAVYIETPLELTPDSKFTFEADAKIMQADLNNSIDFYQKSSEEFTIFKPKEILSQGSHLAGWIDISSDEIGSLVLIRDFWQQFPKGYRLDKEKGLLITEIWPKKAGDLDFKTTQAAYGPEAVARGSAFGVAKTHSLMFYFHKGNFKAENTKEIVSGFSEDALIRPDPQWIADTKALGKLAALGLYFQPAEEFLERLFNWAVRQRENFKWYGMIDFGDTLSWYRKEAYDKSYSDWGWHPEGRWGWFNCEAMGTHTGALLQYLRTGSYKYLNFGRDLARHIMDVDTCHYNTVANDERLKGTIPDDYSHVGSMHRHNADHWGGRNEEATHTNLTGIMLYYFITGDERARDVLDEIGSFFLEERITYFGHPDIAPQRGIANILWGDVLMFELTDDDRYIKQADKLANLFYIGQLTNGAWLENYNPKSDRWEKKPARLFMVNYTMPALIEYHKLTGNKAIADCIVKSTEYLIDNEKYSPFFDAMAYSYWLTGDKKFLNEAMGRLQAEIKRQHKDGDPIWGGMLYDKPYYLRPVTYLYSTPWIFAALMEKGN